MKFLKRTFMGLLPLACILLVATACSNDETELNADGEALTEESIPADIYAAFSRMYTGAENVNWSVSGSYAVATFSLASEAKHTAWFGLSDKTCKMDKKSIAYAEAPTGVRNAFEDSEYATWQLSEKVDVVTRYVSGNVQAIYVVTATTSVDGERTKVCLYYTEEGVLVKKVSTVVYVSDGDEDNDYSDLLPQTPVSSIVSFVSTHYPNARYICIYHKSQQTIVKLLDGRLVREVVFGADGNWLYTETELKQAQAPEAVIETWKTSEYADCKLEKIKEYATAEEGTYYLLELKDRAKGDITLRIEADGTLAGVDADVDADDDNTTSGDIETFIAQHYPGAVVLKRDADDKKVEIEISYKGIKINLTFNWPSQAWVESEWKLDWSTKTNVPAAVSATIAESYAAYNVDYITYNEKAEADSWYEVGLHSSKLKKGMTVLIAADGKVIAEYNH